MDRRRDADDRRPTLWLPALRIHFGSGAHEIDHGNRSRHDPEEQPTDRWCDHPRRLLSGCQFV